MKTFKTRLVGWVAAAALTGAVTLPVGAQSDSTTYTVDPSFDSGELFFSGSGGISSIVPYDDGRILVGGGFETSGPGGFTLFNGLGMVWGDGSEYTQWGGGEGFSVPQVLRYQDGFVAPKILGFGRYTENGTPILIDGHAWVEYLWPQNPYNFASMWCAYVQEDDKVLIGGAVATDTTQPNLYRNLVRVLPDGSHDTSFPAIEIEPNHENSRIITIDKDSQDNWLVSGNFYAINGHETAFVARLNADFSVDTTYVSGLKYVFSIPEPHVVLMDSQDRLWLTHGSYMVAQNNPLDTVDVLRLLPSGAVDTTFVPRHIAVEFPLGSVPYGSWWDNLQGGLELSPDRYMLYGAFNYWNDTLQHCITVVDDAGYIQPHYFMGGGATEHSSNGIEYEVPYIGAVQELPDGSLIVGGGFSKFMGTEHYSLIKLNRGTIGTRDHVGDRPLSLWPNPATEHVWLSVPDTRNAEVSIYDPSGRTVYRGTMSNEITRIPTAGFAPGMYLVHVKDERGTGVKKIVVE